MDEINEFAKLSSGLLCCAAAFHGLYVALTHGIHRCGESDMLLVETVRVPKVW